MGKGEKRGIKGFWFCDVLKKLIFVKTLKKKITCFSSLYKKKIR